MASVYLATDIKHRRQVAVKVLRPDVGAMIGADRFLREIELVARLAHPNILPLHDSGEVGGYLFYVMPYVEDGSLRDRLQRERSIPISEALHITQLVAAALHYAHRQSVLHRDVKPENILLQAGIPVLADFGIGKDLSGAGTPDLTETGIAVGTPAYMSPEQAGGDGQLDARSDVYSLGCVLFEMLTGQAPFIGRSAAAIMAKRFTEPPPSVQARCAGVGEGLDRALRQAMALDPDERFATATEFADALTNPPDTAPIPDRKTIAVLPFANLSSDPENEYFSDGLTEELIADLSQVGALQVTSRTSSMQLKGTQHDLTTIGRRLGVRYLLEGSVRKAGHDLRITAQLIDAARDAQLWSGKFSGTLDDVFELQERVSRDIVRALGVTLTPGEDRQLGQRLAADAQVVDCYMRARYEFNRMSAAAVERATNLLLQGLALAPGNALLESALGMAEVARAKTAAGYEEARLAQAHARAERLARDHPNLPQGPLTLGVIAFERGQLVETARQLKRVLELDPNQPDALLYLALTFMYAGHIAAARPLVRRLMAADPLSATAMSMEAVVEWFDGRLRLAIAPARRAAEMDPENLIARWIHGYTLTLNGYYDEAYGESEWMQRTSPDSPYSRQLASLLHGLAGRTEDALAVLAPLASVRLDHHESFHIAESYAAAGDPERSLDLLLNAISKGFHPFEYICSYDPLLSRLRSHPRFAGVVEAARMGWEQFAAVRLETSSA